MYRGLDGVGDGAGLQVLKPDMTHITCSEISLNIDNTASAVFGQFFRLEERRTVCIRFS